MLTANVDAARLIAALRGRAMAALRIQRTRMVMEGGAIFTRTILEIAPRDTNRYARSWADANNKAGLPPVQLPTIVPSKRAEKYIDILIDQVDAFKFMVEKLERIIREKFTDKGYRTTGKFYNKLYNRLEGPRGARWRLDRARQELELALRNMRVDGGTFLFMGLFNEQGQYRPIVGKTSGGRTKRQLATIRLKVYGGDGRIIDGKNTTIVQLKSMEPHANFLRWVDQEARTRAKMYGLRSYGRAYAMALNEAIKTGK